MAIDDRGLLPSEVVPLPTPADASSSRWRRFKNWSVSQWAAIRPGPEARRGAVWGTLYQQCRLRQTVIQPLSANNKQEVIP